MSRYEGPQALYFGHQTRLQALLCQSLPHMHWSDNTEKAVRLAVRQAFLPLLERPEMSDSCRLALLRDCFEDLSEEI